MKISFPNCAFAVTIFAALLFTATARSETNAFVLPREVTHAFGDAWLAPFFVNRVEQIYAASEFSGLPSDAILIREIAFRLDQRTSEGPLDATFETVQMRMDVFGGSMQEVLEAKTGFVGNGGIAVYAGTHVNLKGQVENPEAFDLRFKFQNPFQYDRRRGQLVLEISTGAYEGVFGAPRSNVVPVEGSPGTT